MTRLPAFTLLFLMLPAVLANGVTAQPASQREVLPSLAPMLERVSPAVVNISVRGTIEMSETPPYRDPSFRRFFDDPLFRRFFGGPEDDELPYRRETQSVGSGVIIDAARGYIVTNHHVIEDADEIVIRLASGRRLDGKVVGSDPEVDIALVEVDPDGLSALALGDSDALRVGDFVVAIGNPFGLGQTATIGMVSALGRSGLGIEGYEDFIQTDASINPGNSGGALVTQTGELIGVNTAILSQAGGNIGIGFAIPINMVRGVVTQIAEHGEVRRGRLGVLIQDLTPELADAMGLDVREGAIVAEVQSGTAADEAGLESGDVIVGLDGEPVETSARLRNRIGLMAPGAEVSLDVIRGDERFTLAVTLGERDGGAASGESRSEMGSKLTGVRVSPLAEDHPLHGEVEGVLVREVARDSAAARAGLMAGDVIVSADQKPVESVAALREAVAAVDDRPLLLHVRRRGGALFIAVR